MRKILVGLSSFLVVFGALASTNIVTVRIADLDGDSQAAVRKINANDANLDRILTSTVASVASAATTLTGLGSGITTNKPICVPDGSGGFVTNRLAFTNGVLKGVISN